MSPDAPPGQVELAADVSEALRHGRPVVALESTIICHGMPYPRNVDTALRVEDEIRRQGAVPATVAVLEGRLKIGLSVNEIKYLGGKGQMVLKCSRRDLPVALARHMDGATTVAATMIAAALAGIPVFATGGIGGVHRGVETTMDVSADLEELGRSNVAVVCAGIKSVLDIGRTLEYLETLGVPVVGFRTDSLPAFYTRDSGFPVDYRLDSAAEVAAAMRAKWDLHIDGGIVVANPIPEQFALDAEETEAEIARAIKALGRRNISGKNATPFLLERIAEQTGGRSLDANVELVLNNARLAAQIATAYCEDKR